MTEIELRQLFKNSSDCYADTWDWGFMGESIQGEVIQAMTEDKFIEILSNLDLIDIVIDDTKPRLTLHPFKKMVSDDDNPCELCRYDGSCSERVHDICVNELKYSEYYLKINEKL